MLKTLLIILSITSITIQISGKKAKNSSRIINGNEVRLGQFPWYVYLEVIQTSGGMIVCGGSLLSTKWVLTAAHCINNAAIAMLHFGLVYINASTYSAESDTFIIHPFYGKSRILNVDVGLIKIADKIEFNKNIKPVLFPPLSIKIKNLVGKKCSICGFGVFNVTGKQQPKTLRRANFNIISRFKCPYKLPLDVMCATATKKNQNVCFGDSGGGLIYNRNGKSYIVGVASFVSTEDCIGQPAGFQPVMLHRLWISYTTGIRIKIF